MRFYSLISSFILSVFLLFISGSESVKTLKDLTVRRGGSLTVPCLYDKKYKSNRKFWCSGYFWSTCTKVAYTNTSGRTSVTDHPSQNMFTVDLKNLKDSDSGYYWCAVEIDGDEAPDDRDYVYLTVSSDPAVWVKNSRVSGQEGGSVSVQGFYSSGYKNKEKKWCRFKDWSCYTFQNSAVKISEDKKKRSFTVEMSGLQKSDAGWYWFSAGDVGVTVHLTVTDKPTTTTTTTTVTTVPTTQKTSIHQSTSSSSNAPGTTENSSSVWVLMAVGLVLLLVLFSLLTCMLRRSCKGNQAEVKERSSDPAVHMTSTTENTLIYSTVIHDNKKPSTFAAAPENNVIYSSVRRSRKNKTLSPAVGDEGVIYSSVLHEQEVYANAILQ